MKESLKSKSWPFIAALLEKFSSADAYLVGGSVRDTLLGRPAKDDDFVICHVSQEDLKNFLSTKGKVNLVGKRFGVLKFRPKGSKVEYDVALPRKESSRSLSGAYRDFDIYTDPELPIEEDLARRDFTINAMAYNLRTNQLVDPFLGQKDLKAKQIRAVGATTLRFQEDYSRMLRAVRFSCQLGFSLTEATKKAITKLGYHLEDKDGNDWVVAREVISQEFLKAFDASPVAAIKLLDELGLLSILLPEVKQLQDCQQSGPHHLEGSVYTHALMSLEKTLSKEYLTQFPDPLTVFTKICILLHDIGKPSARSIDKNERAHFTGHPEKGAQLAGEICRRLHLGATPYAPFACPDLAWVIRHHLFSIEDQNKQAPFTTLEELFFSDTRPSQTLLQTMLADLLGAETENPRKQVKPFFDLMKRLKQMAPNGKLPEPLLDGNDVIELLNIQPGPEVKSTLLDLREKQFRGEITTTAQAKSYLQTHK